MKQPFAQLIRVFTSALLFTGIRIRLGSPDTGEVLECSNFVGRSIDCNGGGTAGAKCTHDTGECVTALTTGRLVDTRVTPSGSTSVTVTALASPGPLL